ncbi:MAG: hypothetical protein ACJ72V_20580 [Nitrososphaeraceae archaeon]
MRKTISLVIVLTLTFGVILASTTSAGSLMVFAQSNQTNSSSSPRLSPASPLHITKIKITSPTRGQQVPVGKDLTISGTSIDNATSNCQVSVIANKVRPYQPATSATGAGSGGAANDYSKWNFVLTSKYTTIKPGQNRITAKYECVNNPDLTGFSSVNVTGVPATATTTPTNQTKSSSSPQATKSTAAAATALSQSTNQQDHLHHHHRQWVPIKQRQNNNSQLIILGVAAAQQIH